MRPLTGGFFSLTCFGWLWGRVGRPLIRRSVVWAVGPLGLKVSLGSIVIVNPFASEVGIWNGGMMSHSSFMHLALWLVLLPADNGTISDNVCAGRRCRMLLVWLFNDIHKRFKWVINGVRQSFHQMLANKAAIQILQTWGCQGLYDMKFQLQGGISAYQVGHELWHSDFRVMTERAINSEMTRPTEPSLCLNKL